MTAQDSTEAVLLWLLGFLSLMAAWCVAEALRGFLHRRRVRRYLDRVIWRESAVDRSKYALRSTVRHL